MARKPKKLPTIPRAPAELAELWHSLAEGQLASYRRLHELCDVMLNDYFEAIANPQQGNHDEDGGPPIHPSAVRHVAEILNIATTGESKAAMQQFRDGNTAIALTQQLGFIVQDPRNGRIMIDPDAVPKYQQQELL